MAVDPATLRNLFATVSLGAPQNAVGFVMWRVMHRYIREVDRCLRVLDLTHLQFTMLALIGWIGRDGTTGTQSELARMGDIHPMQVSTVLKALEQKQMVERTPAPTNALAKRVAMTDRGAQALRDALPSVIAVQDRLFGAEGAPGGALLNLLLAFETSSTVPPGIPV